MTAAASARTSLIVDGQEVPGLDQQTVPGVSYAPARAFAAALGAELEVSFGTVELRLPGRLLQLRLASDPARTDAADSAAVDGRTVEGHAALQTDAGVLLPVKTVAAAFGGFVTVLGGTRDAVDVRLPSATVTGLERAGSGSGERLLINMSAPVPVRTYFNERTSELQLYFSRTRQPMTSELEGTAFLQARFLQGSQEPELRVQLAPGTTWNLTSVPAGTGVQHALTFTPQAASLPVPESQGAPVATGGTVLLDPPATTALVDLALAVAGELRQAGVDVTLTRNSASEQATTLLGAASADVYLRLEAGASTAVSFLGDAQSEVHLQQAAVISAADTTAVEQLRRQLLLGHYGDLSAGAQTAALLAEQLGAAAPVSLPLAALVPAAGKGVHLTVETESLADPGLPGRLAAGLLRALGVR